MVFAYSKMEQVIALNVETINFFCLPHFVEVSGFSMLSICFALLMVTFTCCENVSLGSRMMISKISKCFVVGNVWLLNLSDRFVLYSAGSSVKSVVVVFFCVYMKIISGGPFIYLAEIWLNKLLGLTVIGTRCSDCYIISICYNFYVFWAKWNVRCVNVE